jgi:hypothetical protein
LQSQLSSNQASLPTASLSLAWSNAMLCQSKAVLLALAWMVLSSQVAAERDLHS